MTRHGPTIRVGRKGNIIAKYTNLIFIFFGDSQKKYI